MNTPLTSALLVTTALCLASGSAEAATPLPEARAAVATPGEAAPVAASAATERDVLAGLLGEAGYSASSVGLLAETERHVSPTSGRTYVTYEQRVGSIPVYGSHVRVTIEADGTVGRLVHRIAEIDVQAARRILMGLAGNASARTVSQAAERVFEGGGPLTVRSASADKITFDGGEFYYEDPYAERVIVADTDGTIGLGYLVVTWAAESNELVHTLIDTRGQIVSVEDRTARDSFVVFERSPLYANPVVKHDAEADPVASPEGWPLASGSDNEKYIRGWNVRAQVDRDADNRADDRGATVPDGNYDTMPDLTKAATDEANQRAAVQTLFYQINVIHDVLYRHGFTETAANFQISNYGRGGRQGDFVVAEAVDGSGKNNANFGTSREGYAGTRMQMFEWTRAVPSRNSSFEPDVIWHEYGHGLTWRIVGGMSGRISGALGEGMSDALAVVMTDEDRIGEWIGNSAKGIRRHRYADYRLSFADVNGASVHRDGEVYAAAIWRTYELFKEAGKPRELLMDYIVEGLKNTPPGPDFMQMRDGLLFATGQAEQCLVWEAFARYGMGEGASMTLSGSQVTTSPSDAVPAACGGSSEPEPRPEWEKCADEGGTCEFTGIKTVRYGADGRYETRGLEGPVRCTNAVFGDPAPGTRKACDLPVEAPRPEWEKCADEGGTCEFTGIRTVRYGANGQYATEELEGPVLCNNATFGDPTPGVRKACDLAVEPLQPAWEECAEEGGTCEFTGTKRVRYGAGGTYNYAELPGPVRCSNATFGDPTPGVRKACAVER